VPGTRIVTDLRSFIPRDEVHRDDRSVRKTFGIRDYVIVGVVREEGVFNVPTLRYVKALGEDFGRLEGVHKVRSLFTEDDIRSTPSGLRILPFLRTVAPESVAEARSAVRSFPAVQGTLVSPDLTCATLLVEIEDGADKRDVVVGLRRAADRHSPPAGLSVHLSGLPVFEGVLGDYVLRDLLVMVPIVAVVVVCLLWLAYRSPVLVAVSVVEVAVVNVWALGLMAAVSVPLYIVHAIMPVILVALAVADEIHIMGHYFETAGEGLPVRERVLRTMREMSRPVILTSVTTAAGFLSFLATSMRPLRCLGLFTAVGVMGAMVFSLTVTPVALVLAGGGRSRSRSRRSVRTCLRRLGGTLFERRRVLRLVVACVALVSLIGASRLYVQDSYIANFKRSSHVYHANRLLNDKLLGTRMMHVALDIGHADGVKEPAFLEALDRAQARIDRLDGVGGSVSVVEVIKKMNVEMDARRRRYAVPDSRRVVAYYLLLMEGRSYDSLWDDAYRRARLTVFCKKGDYRTSRVVVPAVREALADELPGVRLTLGGDFALGRHWLSLVAGDQVRSLVTSLSLVFAVAAVFFWSLRRAAMVAAPILLAVAMNFGAMGLLGVPLGVATSAFSSIILGVGIDYAIHLRSRFDRLRDGGSAREALGGAFGTAGTAIFWDVAVVTTGFLVLLLSNMPPTRKLGVVVAVGVVTSLVATFLLIPAFVRGRSDAG
jgi:predicted RND superfamily exporter protein